MSITVKNVSQPKELLEAYLQECIICQNALQEFLADLDNPEQQKKIARLLHRLSGSSGFLGFSTIADHARTLEKGLYDSHVTSLTESLLSELNALIQEITDALNA